NISNVRFCPDVCFCLLLRAENWPDYDQQSLLAAGTDVTCNSYLWFLPALLRKQSARRFSARRKSRWPDAVLGSETGEKSRCGKSRPRGPLGCSASDPEKCPQHPCGSTWTSAAIFWWPPGSFPAASKDPPRRSRPGTTIATSAASSSPSTPSPIRTASATPRFSSSKSASTSPWIRLTTNCVGQSTQSLRVIARNAPRTPRGWQIESEAGPSPAGAGSG